MDTATIKSAADKLAAAKAEYEVALAALNASAPTDVSASDALKNVIHQAKTGVDLEPGSKTSEIVLAKQALAGIAAIVTACGVSLDPEHLKLFADLLEPLVYTIGGVVVAYMGFRTARKNAVDRAR